ncbi:MAG: urate hydroxylase PuuD [Acidobacteria bacterium]|nr:urate hydroxylase PuuD [Acidobacteriota bacterium]
MGVNWSEWFHLALRWFHVFAGILWIGQTWFFTWLDRRFSENESNAAGAASGQVWMVHSGGFYIVEKQRGVEVLPARLHWFRWEAALTWLSGFVLLLWVYYWGGALVDADVADLHPGTAAALGLGVLVLGWVVYDALWTSPLARAEATGAALSFLLLAAASYGLTQIFSGRAAYIHVGALLGTIMTANVWLRILPAQRAMLAAAREGKPVDLSLSARARQRTKHNTYMVVPVVFLMVSNHFPVATYGHRYNWAILLLLILLGWGAAHILRRT